MRLWKVWYVFRESERERERERERDILARYVCVCA